MSRRVATAALALVAAAGGCRRAAPAIDDRPFDPASPGPVELPGEPMNEPFPWRPVAASAAAALVAAALVARRTRRAASPPSAVLAAPAPVSAEPPHVAALRRIERLRAQTPRTPDDHVETAAIVRDYVRERFGVRAGERTTEELLGAPELPPAARPALAAVLRSCDLVKFARDEPCAAARAALFDAAEAFVRGTASA
jgi:hypothetical protein